MSTELNALFSTVKDRYRQGIWALAIWALGVWLYKFVEHWFLAWLLRLIEPWAGSSLKAAVSVGVLSLPPLTWLLSVGVLVWLAVRTFGPDSHVQVVYTIFERCQWSGGRLCRDLLVIQLCETFKEQAERLEELQRELENSAAAEPPPALQWAQETFAKLCDEARHSTSRAPGVYGQVETKALECYAALVSWFSAAQILRATDDCRRWLRPRAGRESQARETLRILLSALLDNHPGNKDLLALYEDVIAKSSDEDLVKGALSMLPELQLRSADRRRILDAGFRASVRQWKSLYLVWSTAVSWSLQTGQLDAGDKRQLVEHIGDYIRSEKPTILTQEPRRYLMLCSVIAQLHNQHAGVRPKNRHLVVGGHGVDAGMTFSSSGEEKYLRGKIGNFSLGDKIWSAGAWITSAEYHVIPKGGVSAVLKVTDEALPDLEIVLPNVRIIEHNGETPSNNSTAYPVDSERPHG